MGDFIDMVQNILIGTILIVLLTLFVLISMDILTGYNNPQDCSDYGIIKNIETVYENKTCYVKINDNKVSLSNYKRFIKD